eukprot:CAMPEP_0175139394 /NCGR_PEP_ID=MMETSP0087-20121206/10876_1 /TAXON_ID=136419 /ORGANISM="Unknown Unknown, Strain D1" /LENGTH=419 /DNA_ID=CAMNT_0016422395 /DNA_START=125 /DNA_END=1384 /DNA_ORIENTATION=+
MRLKVIVLGESKSGKTELIKRYRFEHHSKHPNLAVRYPDDEFNKDYSPTLGVDFFDAVKVRKRRENGETLRVVTGFYDMGGDIKFLKVRSEFYADYSGIILCFDTTSRASFAGLQFWIDEAEKFGQNKKPTNVVVVGTRVDDTMERVVTAREAKQWASERKFTYFDTSAYTGQGVVEAVESLLDKSSATYRQPNIKMPKATTSFSSAQRNRSSRPPSAAPVSSTQDPDKMSMKEIKAELAAKRVSVADCLEKADFVKKLKEVRAGVDHAFLEREAEKKRKAQEKVQREKMEREAENLKDRTNKEVDSWSQGKDVRRMLNEILGYKERDEHYLNRMSGMEKVAKAYKKAVLKIHPDKVSVNDKEAHARATEMFKAVNNAFENFKKQSESRMNSTPDFGAPAAKPAAGRRAGAGSRRGRRS